MIEFKLKKNEKKKRNEKNNITMNNSVMEEVIQ